MDATLKLKAEQLVDEIASQAETLDVVNGLLNALMKSALERIAETGTTLFHGGSYFRFVKKCPRRVSVTSLPQRRCGSHDTFSPPVFREKVSRVLDAPTHA
jgi:hypothetical protein